MFNTGMLLIYGLKFYHLCNIASTFFFSLFSQKPPKPPHVRRGPSNLQIKPPWRDVRLKNRHDTSRVVEEPVQADKEEKTEKSVIR